MAATVGGGGDGGGDNDDGAGERAVLDDVRRMGWADVAALYARYPGTAKHYRYFLELVGGGGGGGGGAHDSAKMRAIFRAQLLKDAALAATIQRAIRMSLPSSSPSLSSSLPDKNQQHQQPQPVIYVVTGSGHCDFGFGAPERLHGEPSFRVSSRPEEIMRDEVVVQAPTQSDQDQGQPEQQQQERFWSSPPPKGIADSVFVYE